MPGMLLDYWPAGVTAVGGLALAVASVRYRIPDLVRRVEKLEAEQNPSREDMNRIGGRLEILENQARPTTEDLERAIAAFQTVCKFNQFSCQKMNSVELVKLRKEIEVRISGLYDLINKQAVLLGRVDERVAALSNQSLANQAVHVQNRAIQQHVLIPEDG